MASGDHRPIADISVITTVLNESASVRPLIDSILSGTRLPVEIVVADGGSTDGTVDVIAAYLGDSAPVVLVPDAGDRSSGRNVAIETARSERIASIDAGCVARSDWLERIEAAFEDGADWIGGFYVPVGSTPLSTAIGLTMVYVIEEAAGHFIPSARSMAFTKEVWEQAGRFPSGTQFGEDTLFADRLLLEGHPLRFVPEALVEWAPPPSLPQMWRTMCWWGFGDGIAGLRGESYKRSLLAWAASISWMVVSIIVEPWLALLALLPIGGLTYGRTRFKYRHMHEASRWLLIPLASLTGTTAALVGFLQGRSQRKQAERAS